MVVLVFFFKEGMPGPVLSLLLQTLGCELREEEVNADPCRGEVHTTAQSPEMLLEKM